MRTLLLTIVVLALACVVLAADPKPNKKGEYEQTIKIKLLRGKEGPPGLDGVTGPRGREGIPGLDGITGARGHRGHRGHKGASGPRGHKGPAGNNGKDGKDGSRGKRGHRGATGAIGIQGNKGNPGPKGDKGVRGNVGPQGPTGAIDTNILNSILARITSLETRLASNGNNPTFLSVNSSLRSGISTLNSIASIIRERQATASTDPTFLETTDQDHSDILEQVEKFDRIQQQLEQLDEDQE